MFLSEYFRSLYCLTRYSEKGYSKIEFIYRDDSCILKGMGPVLILLKRS